MFTMTIKELIEELKKYPEDFTIRVNTDMAVADIHKEDIKYGLNEDRKELVL